MIVLVGVSRNCKVSPVSSGANQLHMVLSRATMQSVRAEQQTRAQRAVTQRPQPTASDGFLARLGQAESRDTARAQQSRMIQHQQQRFIPPTHAQLLHDLDDGLRTPRRTLADKKLLVQERSPPSPPKPPSQPSWADANVLRNVSLLGSKSTRGSRRRKRGYAACWHRQVELPTILSTRPRRPSSTLRNRRRGAARSHPSCLAHPRLRKTGATSST